jgi:hypothetical protein
MVQSAAAAAASMDLAGILAAGFGETGLAEAHMALRGCYMLADMNHVAAGLALRFACGMLSLFPLQSSTWPEQTRRE